VPKYQGKTDAKEKAKTLLEYPELKKAKTALNVAV